jgi:amino acid transporter
VSEQHPQPGPQPWPPQPSASPWPSQPDPAPALRQAPPPARPQAWPTQFNPAHRGIRFRSAHEAEHSRRRRLSVGIAGLILGAGVAYYAYENIASVARAVNALEAQGRHVSQPALMNAVLIIAIYVLVALAYLGVGVWNIIARRGISSAPVIASLVLSAVVIVLIVLLLIRSAVTGGAPQYGGLITNVFIIVRSIGLLRMKKEPVPYGTVC